MEQLRLFDYRFISLLVVYVPVVELGVHGDGSDQLEGALQHHLHHLPVDIVVVADPDPTLK